MHDRIASRLESVQVERWSVLADIVGHARSRVEHLSGDMDHATPRLLLERLTEIETYLAANPYSHEGLYDAMLMLRDVFTPLSSLVTAIAAGQRERAPGPCGPP
jgi:hypothetical protein